MTPETLLVWSIAATRNIGPLKVWEYDAKGGDWHTLADAQRRAREPSARLMRFTSLPTEKTLSLNDRFSRHHDQRSNRARYLESGYVTRQPA